MPRVPFDLDARRPYLVQTFSDAEYEQRIGAACDAMAREGLDALVIYASGTAASAVTYLTNYVPVYGNVFVVLHADGRIALASRLGEVRPADHVLAGIRLSKSDEEIAKMREAGRIADAAYEAVFATVAPGVEETTVAAAAVHRMHVLGGREGFTTSVVGGAQAGLKHGHPRRRPLVQGEMVFLDLGVAFDGYMSDESRCTVVGSARGAARDLLQIGLDLYHAGLQVMGPGRAIDDISHALLAVVRGTKHESYYCPGGFGHGIGMAVIEAPGLYAATRPNCDPG